MGRRPKPKSDEFLESTPLVFEIITILCFETAEQVLYCLGARPILLSLRSHANTGKLEYKVANQVKKEMIYTCDK